VTQTIPNTQAAAFPNADREAVDAAILAEQIRLLADKRVDLPVNFILAVMVAGTLWQFYPVWVVVSWLALFTAVLLFRYYARRRYQTTAPAAAEARRWARLSTLNAFATACLWGLTGSVVLITADPLYQVFIVFALGGVTAGGIVLNSAYLPTMLAFALPTILPVIVALSARGNIMQIEMSVMLMIFAATLVATGHGINRSITENLRLRIGQDFLLRKLRASEAEMAEAQSIAQIGSWEIALQSDSSSCSMEAFHIFGVDPATFKPSFEAMLARVHPDDREAVKLAYAKKLEIGQHHGIDFRLMMDDGAIKHVHELSRTTFDEEGRALRINGIVQDVTERKRAETALQFANTLLTTQMEASPDGILVVDPKRTILSFNRRFSEMWQIPITDLASGSDPRVLDQVVSLVKNGDSFRSRANHLYRHPDEKSQEEYETTDGRFIECLSSTLSSANDPNLGRVWLFRDITERKQAAIALAYRDKVLHAITQCAATLVAGKTLGASLPQALKITAEALQIDRMLILKRNVEPAAPRLALIASWQRDDVPQMGAPFLAISVNSAEIDAWFAPLSDGRPVATFADTATGVVKQILHDMNICSNLLVPIAVAGAYWGHIGIDDCKTVRRWSPVEMDSLTTLAEIIGALLMREQTNTRLETSEQRFRAVTETAQDAIIAIDSAARVTYWNPAATQIFGYTKDEAVGRNVHEWLAPRRYRQKADAGMKEFASTGRGDAVGITQERAALRKDGVEFPIEVSLSGLAKGSDWSAVAIIRDITARKLAEGQLVRMARFDLLTGLANRNAFVDALQQAIALTQRGGRNFAVLYLDLDHFKDVNDTLGHPIGDRLLQLLAQRFQRNIRAADTVARFGGDEFALIATDIVEPDDAATLAEKTIKSINESFWIQGNEIRIGASIGIALYGADSPDAETLLSRADVALYRAKADGRGAYRFFTDSMDAEVRDRVRLGVELRDALAFHQLFLVYQPQIDVDSGEIIGLEALVRWRHPKRGVVSPNDFIPVAEKTGLIVSLGHWVLGEACRQMKEWLDAGIAPSLIAVNVSAMQLRQRPELEREIADILASTGVPPNLLELELTESVFMDAPRERGELLLRLRKSGLRIAIDDFGTGYSSLEYLSRFPVDRIKIAQTFMHDLTPGSPNAKIVKAAISLAHDLGLDVIIEGVETAEQLALVRSWSGKKVQGFYCYKPLPAEETTAALRSRHASAQKPAVASS
jgi:diguanylate cyclase (GGDEF)-like protein/PAS domain S-box-containing protein